MTETLVIRLRASEDAPASWLIVDANGARSGNVQSGPIADALALSQGRRTVVVLPAADVTLARPDLPPVRGAAASRKPSRSRSKNTSPPTSRTCTSPSASAMRRRVPRPSRSSPARRSSAGTRLWDAAGIRPDAAYAESSLIPSAPNALVLVLDEGTLHVSRPDKAVYALDAEPLPTGTRPRARRADRSRRTRHVLRVDGRLRDAQGNDRRPAGAHRDAAGQAAAGRHAVPAGLAGAGRPADQPAAGRVCGADVVRFAAAAMATARRARGRHAGRLPRRAGLQALAAAPGRKAARRADHRDVQPDPARATDRRSARTDPGRAGSRRRRQRRPAAGHLFAGASHCAGARHARRGHQLPRGRARTASRRRRASKRSTASSRP